MASGSPATATRVWLNGPSAGSRGPRATGSRTPARAGRARAAGWRRRRSAGRAPARRPAGRRARRAASRHGSASSSWALWPTAVVLCWITSQSPRRTSVAVVGDPGDQVGTAAVVEGVRQAVELVVELGRRPARGSRSGRACRSGRAASRGRPRGCPSAAPRSRGPPVWSAYVASQVSSIRRYSSASSSATDEPVEALGQQAEAADDRVGLDDVDGQPQQGGQLGGRDVDALGQAPARVLQAHHQPVEHRGSRSVRRSAAAR